MAVDVQLTPVLAAYTKVIDKPGKGTGNIEVTGNVTLFIPKDIVDYFGMPEPTSQDVKNTIVPTLVKAHKRTSRLRVSSGANTVDVPAFQRMNPGNNRGISIWLPFEDTVGKESVTIRVPSLWKKLMIMQFLSTALKKHTPTFFKVGKGKSIPLIKNLPAELMAGCKSGAWSVVTPITPKNVDDTSVPPTIIIQSRGYSGKDAPKNPAPTP